MTVGLLAATIAATVVLPLLFGYWIGHSVLAAAPFVALGATVLIRQIDLRQPGSMGREMIAGILVSTAFSATSAYFGGRARERRGGTPR
jgi:predicted benzoate:H+ symporter BenE